jgi:hypothetical protein
MPYWKQWRPAGDVVNCPVIGTEIHTFRSASECRESHGCSTMTCPLTSQFLFDESCSYAQYIKRHRRPIGLPASAG